MPYKTIQQAFGLVDAHGHAVEVVLPKTHADAKARVGEVYKQ